MARRGSEGAAEPRQAFATKPEGKSACEIDALRFLKSDKKPSGRSHRTRAKPAVQTDPQRMRQAAAASRRAYPCIGRHGGGSHPRCAESAWHRQTTYGGTGTGSLRRRFALTRQAGKMHRAASRLIRRSAHLPNIHTARAWNRKQTLINRGALLYLNHILTRFPLSICGIRGGKCLYS